MSQRGSRPIHNWSAAIDLGRLGWNAGGAGIRLRTCLPRRMQEKQNARKTGNFRSFRD